MILFIEVYVKVSVDEKSFIPKAFLPIVLVRLQK